jgi:EAL domain-containing protein (putative c-di-GMP-specific phosphodiesterase class I)
VALDDFGTGHSTLARLYTLPIDKIKLDKQFVQGLEVAQGQAIVKAMCALAKSLNTELVVEGVETPVQREQLLSLGCETAQGYLTGAPAPLAHWLQT